MAPKAPKPGDPEPSGKPLLWLAAALVAAAIVVLVVLLLPDPRVAAGPVRPREERSPDLADPLLAPPPGSSLARVAQRPPVAEAPPPAPRPGASSLTPFDLFEGESLELLRMGREVTARGAPLNSARLKEIYQFGKDHPGDARPHLLMGSDAMNRDWYGFAVDHYVRAQKEDPRARQDPRMLRDLLQMAGSEHYASKSGTVIRDVYGPHAIKPLEDAISEAASRGDAARTERLTALARSLSEPPVPP